MGEGQNRGTAPEMFNPQESWEMRQGIHAGHQRLDAFDAEDIPRIEQCRFKKKTENPDPPRQD